MIISFSVYIVEIICQKLHMQIYTLKKHQKIRTIGIFQKFLTEEMHCSQWRINILNNTTQFSEDMREIYI